MPGLGEMHAHLPEPSDPPEYMRTTLALYVANGVTAVRCMRGFPNHLNARREVLSGKLLVHPSFWQVLVLEEKVLSRQKTESSKYFSKKSEGWDMIKRKLPFSVSIRRSLR